MHLFLGMLLHMLLFLHVHNVVAELNLSQACSELADASARAGDYTSVVSRKHDIVCNKSSAGFVVWSRWISKRNRLLRVVIRRCPRILRVWILTESDAHFIASSTDLQVSTCRNTNDTITLPSNNHNKEKLDVHALGNDGVNIIVLLEERDGGSIFYTTHKYHLAPQSKHRHHRDKREAAPGPQPASDGNGAVTSSPINHCGLNRTCIRYGTSDCDHMTCDYFLSYYVMEAETIDIELSGKSNGWVAIGFSSDEKMGGGDDIIACKRKDQASDEIEVQSLLNQVAHSSPQPKPNALNLTKWANKNGYIYCRVTRKLKVEMANNLDLSNDWFQLYARGPVGSSGVMLQHDEIPPTSKEKITVLISENVYPSGASSRHYTLVGILCLLFSFLAIS